MAPGESMLTKLGLAFSSRESLLKGLGLSALILSFVLLGVAPSGMEAAGIPAAFPAALCQVVYPLDQYPGAQGYHYIFFGNGFFINNGGYLITAAHVLSSFRAGG